MPRHAGAAFCNHRVNLQPRTGQPFHSREGGGPPYEPLDEYSLLEADPGDVIFFDSYVPNGSSPNISDRSRRNIFLTFNRESAGNLWARYYADK